MNRNIFCVHRGIHADGLLFFLLNYAIILNMLITSIDTWLVFHHQCNSYFYIDLSTLKNYGIWNKKPTISGTYWMWIKMNRKFFSNSIETILVIFQVFIITLGFDEITSSWCHIDNDHLSFLNVFNNI